MALLPLMAMLLFVVVFTAHTHEQCASTTDGAAFQHAVDSCTNHCTACELIASGTGNTLIAPAIRVGECHTQHAIAATADGFIYPGYRISLPSRAPPA